MTLLVFAGKKANLTVEWQLVGYGGRTTKKKAVSTVAETQTPPRKPSKSESRKQLTPTAPTAPAVPGPSFSRKAAAARGTPRGKARGTLRGQAVTPRAAVSAQANRLFRDSPSKSRWRNGTKPTGMLQLPAAFGTFKYDFLGAARSTTFVRKNTAVQGRYEVFEDISKRTGAFVKPPGYTDQVIYIWGEPNQVVAAEEQLKALLSKCNSSNKPRKRADWTKIHAHSVKKEANVEFKENSESMLQQLRKQPESGIFPEQLLFLWPKDGPSLSECLGPQLESLDIIRARFGCHLFVPKDLPGHICVLGHNHDDMKQIAQRIRTLWAEMVAKSNVKANIYLVEPPEPSSMEREIIINKQNQLHKPSLQGGPLKDRDLDRWQDRIGLIQSKNNARLLTAIENCLRGVSFVRGHLRMRVNLGTFVLENYQVPEDDRSWYGFEEFREMLLHEQTKGRLIPGLKVGQSELLERCFKATHLFEPCDSTSTSLQTAELAHSVNFEFLGADKSMLRLEAEFARNPGARDYEIKERRWLRPRTGGQSRDKRAPLHVAVIDFGRSDWQLEIKSLEFYEASSIEGALKSFSHSIGFRSMETVADIAAKPERKVTFPATAPVSRFVEKTAIRYRVKGTKYIFEIARYDEYRRANVSVYPGQAGPTITGGISDVPFTSWGASVFDANWDNLLGGHANLPVGQSASYAPSLATFFPSKEPSPTLEYGPKGFWEFVDIVKQAADLLGPTRASPENHATDAASNTESSLKAGSLKNKAASAAVPSPTSATGSASMPNADLGTLF
ncbi:hypothetical protein BDW59DRAFT_181826 [Aspergillus cavernicola]|uniref:DUF7905 domain-containing protein n=1 Tax=Aspergillus cavernicola TaxID=176166 RepID=A0ABR4HU49_9EURO